MKNVLKVDDSRWSITIQKSETIGGFVQIEITP